MGRALHRRPARRARAPRRGPWRRVLLQPAKLRCQHPGVPPAQRHGGRARAAGARYHRLAMQGRGVLRANRKHAARESSPSVTPVHGRRSNTIDHPDVRHAVRAGRAPRRGPPYRQRAWPIQRAERRAVHVAPPELPAAGRLGATNRRQALHVRSAGPERRAVQHAADRALGDAGDRARQRADAVFAAGVARCPARLIRGRQHAAQLAGRRCRCRAAGERHCRVQSLRRRRRSGRMRHRRERPPSTPSWGEPRSTWRPRAAP